MDSATIKQAAKLAELLSEYAEEGELHLDIYNGIITSYATGRQFTVDRIVEALRQAAGTAQE